MCARLDELRRRGSKFDVASRFHLETRWAVKCRVAGMMLRRLSSQRAGEGVRECSERVP